MPKSFSISPSGHSPSSHSSSKQITGTVISDTHSKSPSYPSGSGGQMKNSVF